jgi:hypothetical protein
LPNLEHPSITQANKMGYANMVAQPEHAGSDYFDEEILVGDDVVIDGEELILQSNLEKYLTEVYGFQFKTAE